MNPTKSDRPFWDFMMNLAPVKWFCNLSISKKVMQLSIAQKIFNYEMVTYVFYGVLTTAINLLVFWMFCGIFGVPTKDPEPQDTPLFIAANTIAFILALIFAFVTNKLIVFKSKSLQAKLVFKEFISFTVARLVTFGCETLIVGIAPLIHFNVLLAKIIAQIIVVILNYIFSKVFIFKSKTQKSEGDPS